jgi:hypothetical protein
MKDRLRNPHWASERDRYAPGTSPNPIKTHPGEVAERSNVAVLTFCSVCSRLFSDVHRVVSHLAVTCNPVRPDTEPYAREAQLGNT